MKFTHECTQCGACCLFEICVMAKAYYGDQERSICPGLSFDGDIATCHIAPGVVPIGDGCCIKARAYKDGVEYDFAALPPELKIKAVQQIRRSK